MAIEIKVPALGESITEVEIGEWLVKEGDTLEKDQNLVSIESEKATVEIPAPAAGKLVKQLKASGEKVNVGDVIGMIEPAGKAEPKAEPKAESKASKSETKTEPKAEAAEPADKKEPPKEAAPEAATAPEAEAAPAPEVAPAEKPATAAKPASKKSKAAAKPADQEQPAPATEAPATGGEARRLVAAGGVTTSEIPEAAAKETTPTEETPAEESGSPAEPQGDAPKDEKSPAAKPAEDGRPDEIIRMTPLRRTVAKRLVEAQHTMAILTTFNEVDMSAVMALRKQYQEAFQGRHGCKLGLMSFFVKAAMAGLKLVPQLNAEIRGDDMVYHRYFDIGVAIGVGKGLVVPVLRQAEKMSFADIEKAIAGLAERARSNQLKPDELTGGTFTISNGGVYGSMLSTPIINPPQSGILGLHAIQDRPVARAGQVVIRPMMNVALSYDHRIVDGREAVAFLARVKEVIEDPAVLVLEL